jgi:hypothetical protein
LAAVALLAVQAHQLTHQALKDQTLYFLQLPQMAAGLVAALLLMAAMVALVVEVDGE